MAVAFGRSYGAVRNRAIRIGAHSRPAAGSETCVVPVKVPATCGTRLAEAGGHESVSDLVIAILDAALADMGIAAPSPVPEGGPKAAVEGGE